MNIRHAWTVLGAAVLSSALAFAQSNDQSSATASQVENETPITLVGCLQRESDYRQQNDAGRGGVVGTGLGRGNEYVLINASRAGGAPAEVDCAAASGEAYELTGDQEKQLEPYVGRRIEIAGMLKHADTEPKAVGTSGASTTRPEGGFDPIGQDLRLFEVNVLSFRELGAAPAAAAAEPQPIGTAGAQTEAVVAEGAADVLPQTASPLPLAGLLGLLSLAGAAGIRALRR
jgi:hypothetical protein